MTPPPRLARLPFSRALREFVETGTGLPCGLGEAPPDPRGGDGLGGYSIVYPIGGGGYGGPSLSGPPPDPTWVYQLTCAGGDADQAQWVADLVEALLLGADRPAVDGLVVMGVEKEPPASPVLGELLWSVPDRYRFAVTPTG